MEAALLAGSDVRISKLLALRIEKHISEDRKTIFIRQQRSKKGNIVKFELKTDAAYRKEWAEKVGLGFELPQASKPKSQASESPADVNCTTCATDFGEHVSVANA